MASSGSQNHPAFLASKRIVYPSPKPREIPEFVVNTKIVFDYSVRVLEASTASEDGTETYVPGPVIDDTRKAHPEGYGQPLELVIGRKFKIPAWETCLQTMRVGEVASFDLPALEVLDYPFVSKQLRDIGKGDSGDGHSHGTSMCGGMAAAIGLGYDCLNQLMKAPKPLQVTFELLSVTPPDGYVKDRWQLGANEKLASLVVLKEKGNELFKSSKYSEACDAYGEALARLEDLIVMEKPGDTEFNELAEQKVPFYLNIAQCKLKQGDFYKAIQAVNEVIEIAQGPHLEKALYRRGKANALAWNFEDAKADFNKLALDFPGSENLVKTELAKLALLEKEAAEKDKISGLKGAFCA